VLIFWKILSMNWWNNFPRMRIAFPQTIWTKDELFRWIFILYVCGVVYHNFDLPSTIHDWFMAFAILWLWSIFCYLIRYDEYDLNNIFPPNFGILSSKSWYLLEFSFVSYFFCHIIIQKFEDYSVLKSVKSWNFISNRKIWFWI